MHQMSPIHFNPAIYPPVEPADRSAKGELSLTGDKDRRIERVLRRRRQENPDADQFTPRQETEEPEEGDTLPVDG
jgi:hypothetical protein